jgi:hypothetical protein
MSLSEAEFVIFSDLGVEEDATHDLGVVHGLLESVQRPGMVLVGSMGEVEPGHIHAASKQLLQHRNISGFWAQRAYDLGLRNACPWRIPLPKYALNVQFGIVRHGALLTAYKRPLLFLLCSKEY